MSKHTPGMWKINLHKTMATLEKDCMPGVELPIATMEFHRGKEIDEANAHLIAAAPELLEACKSMVSIFDRDLPKGTVGRRFCDEAKQAIAKAEEIK